MARHGDKRAVGPIPHVAHNHPGGTAGDHIAAIQHDPVIHRGQGSRRRRPAPIPVTPAHIGMHDGHVIPPVPQSDMPTSGGIQPARHTPRPPRVRNWFGPFRGGKG